MGYLQCVGKGQKALRNTLTVGIFVKPPSILETII